MRQGGAPPHSAIPAVFAAGTCQASRGIVSPRGADPLRECPSPGSGAGCGAPQARRVLRGGSSGARVSASQGGVSARGASDHGQSHAGGLSRGKAAGARASAPAGRTRRERSARRARRTPASGGKTEGAGIRAKIGDNLEDHAQEKSDDRRGGCDVQKNEDGAFASVEGVCRKGTIVFFATLVDAAGAASLDFSDRVDGYRGIRTTYRVNDENPSQKLIPQYQYSNRFAFLTCASLHCAIPASLAGVRFVLVISPPPGASNSLPPAPTLAISLRPLTIGVWQSMQCPSAVARYRPYAALSVRGISGTLVTVGPY